MISTNARRSAVGFAIASLVLGASAPAFARAPAPAQVDGGTMSFDSKTGDYCLSQNVTGTRLPSVTCQSKDAWAAQGLNISRK
jgi:hypothetical protein